jgi:hypothetical protein
MECADLSALWKAATSRRTPKEYARCAGSISLENSGRLQRQTQTRLAPGCVLTIFQRERPAVRFSNLAGKDQADS